MSIFNGMISVSGVAFLVFCVMAIIAVGYAIGRITVKGVSLGDSGVFIIALVFGCLFFPVLSKALEEMLSPKMRSSWLKISV